jgi:hypothetical protein
MMERIIAAFTFRKEVYAEVEKDVEFTQTAWILVAVVSLLNQIGQLPNFGFSRIGAWLISAIIMVIFSVAGFALSAFVISWAGKQFFKAETDFNEMVRVLGLAYVWNAIGVIGIVGFIPFLACVLAPLVIVAGIAGFVSWLFAAKEALDLDWVPTAITLVIGWVIGFIITAIAGVIIGVLGVGASVGVGLLSGGMGG